MPTLAIVEIVDLLVVGARGVDASGPRSPINGLALECREEALDDGVVVAVAARASSTMKRTATATPKRPESR